MVEDNKLLERRSLSFNFKIIFTSFVSSWKYIKFILIWTRHCIRHLLTFFLAKKIKITTLKNKGNGYLISKEPQTFKRLFSGRLTEWLVRLSQTERCSVCHLVDEISVNVTNRVLQLQRRTGSCLMKGAPRPNSVWQSR